jgi:protein transport protein SEC20
MAPIPPRLPEGTLSLISAADRRYKHINEVQVPKLQNCVGPLTLQQRLADEVREDTALLARQIDVRSMT